MRIRTFGKRSRCPECGEMLPPGPPPELSCRRCSAKLWSVRFNAAGTRYMLAHKDRALDDVLLEMVRPHNADLVRLLQTPRENSKADPWDFLELYLELLDELERRLPELAD